MATVISISTGALSAQNNYANDAAAQAILLKCAARLGLTGTNQQKLQGVINWLVDEIQQKATEQEFDEQRSSMLNTIEEGNRLT